MTDVNDLLARVMEGVEALCESYGLRPESYPIFKEAHEYLDSLEQGPEEAVAKGRIAAEMLYCLCPEPCSAAVHRPRPDSLERKEPPGVADVMEVHGFYNHIPPHIMAQRLTRLEGVVQYVIQSRHHEPMPDGEAYCTICDHALDLLRDLKEAE